MLGKMYKLPKFIAQSFKVLWTWHFNHAQISMRRLCGIFYHGPDVSRAMVMWPPIQDVTD